MTDGADITRILASLGDTGEAGSDSDASHRALLDAVYAELRALAGGQMRHERKDHTLQPTALVHEAYVRLLGGQQIAWQDRRHFFAAAAEAMRRILIDHARRRGRKKRGGGRAREALDAIEFVQEGEEEDFLALDDAIGRLAERDERMAQVVQLRFFAGRSVEETAELLEISPRTVKREWAFARAWLLSELASADYEEGNDRAPAE